VPPLAGSVTACHFPAALLAVDAVLEGTKPSGTVQLVSFVAVLK
jgi:hypothetical protein